MVKIKRLLAPKFWKVPKKTTKWVVRPSPGPHPRFESIPLQIIVRDILHIADKAREAKSIIKQRKIFVDGKPRTDHRYPVGLMDIVSIPSSDQYFRMTPTANGLSLIAIDKNEATKKLCNIRNKTMIKKGKLQLNLHDGKNILVDKDVYKTGDSLLLELPSQKIISHIKFDKSNLATVIRGKRSGVVAKIKEISTPKFRQQTKVVCKSDGSEFEVLKSDLFIIGEGEPVIKL